MSKENRYLALVGTMTGLIAALMLLLLYTVREYEKSNLIFFILIGLPLGLGIFSILLIIRHVWKATEYKPDIPAKSLGTALSEFPQGMGQQIKNKPYLMLIPAMALVLPLVLYFRDAKFKPLSQGCNGLSVSKATIYTAGAGLHPIVLLSSTGKVNSWTNDLPLDWQPSSIASTELIACGEEKEILIETCNYDIGADVRRYRYQTDIQLFEANSGQKIGEKTFYGSAPRACEQKEDIDTKRLDGAHTSFEDVKTWLSGFVAAGNSPIVRTMLVGNGPHLFVYDGNSMWISNNEDETIQKIDPATGMAGDPISVGNNPVAMVYDGKQLWMVNQGDNTVQKIDPVTEVVSAPITLDINPFFAVIAGERLWIGDSLEMKLQTVDIRTDKVGTPIELHESPEDLIFSKTQTWVVTRWSILSVDADTGKTTSLINFGEEIAKAVFDGRRFWISFLGDNFRPAGYLKVFDTSTSTESILHLQAGAEIRDLLLVGDQLWLAESKDGSLQAIDVATSKLSSTIHVGQLLKALKLYNEQLYIMFEEEYKPSTTTTIITSFILKSNLTTGDISLPAQVGVQVGPGSMISDGSRIWIDNYQTNTVQYIVFPEQ